MASKFKSRMREKARERAAARKNQVVGGTTLRMPDDMKVEFFKPSKTVHNLDIIPYVVSDAKHPDRSGNQGPQVGELWYNRRYYIHRNIGAEENSYVCPARTYGEKCPICEYAKQRKNEGAAKEELDELRPKERQLFNVIDIDDDPDKVMLWDISYFLFGRQLDKELTEGDEEYGAFAELEDGYTLKVRFEKKSFNKNEFFECDRIDFKPRKEDYDEDIVDEAVPLDDILIKMPYNELEQIFIMGGSSDDGEDEEDEDSKRPRGHKTNKPRDGEEDQEKPRKKRRADPEEEEEDEAPKKRRRKPDPEPEDDPEDEAEERPRKKRRKEAEEDEEEPPKRQRKRREPEPEDEEGDGDDGEDEEPEEKPRKKRRADPEEEEAPKKRGGRRSRPEPEEAEDEDEEEEKPRKKSGKSSGGNDKCPNGHKFGKDCDIDDECDACKKWGACNAAMTGD